MTCFKGKAQIRGSPVGGQGLELVYQFISWLVSKLTSWQVRKSISSVIIKPRAERNDLF